MARKTGIQWTKTLSRELSRQVKNYNQRINYARDRGVPPEILPPKITVKEVKSKIKTKRQYRTFITDISKATYQNLVQRPSGKSRYQEQLEKREKRRSEISVVDLNIERRVKQLANIQSSGGGRFPRDVDMFMKELRFTDKPEENYSRLMEWIDSNPESSILWKNNYLKAIDNVMQGAIMAGNTSAVESLQKLYNKISQMDLADYLIGQLVNEANLAIDYVYPERGGDLTSRIDRITSEWSSLLA